MAIFAEPWQSITLGQGNDDYRAVTALFYISPKYTDVNLIDYQAVKDNTASVSFSNKSDHLIIGASAGEYNYTITNHSCSTSTYYIESNNRFFCGGAINGETGSASCTAYCRSYGAAVVADLELV